MKKMMLIINPAAGRSILRDSFMGIVRIFSDKDYIVSVFVTKKRNDAKHFALEYGRDYELIVCAGGDGTLNEVVNGMLIGNVHVPIGFIPAGTTNDFAISHELSKFPRQAARNIVKGTPRPHDIGIFNDRYFTYVAAFGLFSDVSFSTPQPLKNVLGRFAYFFEGAKKIPEITQEYSVFIEIDDIEVYDKVCFLAIANSLSLGGVVQFPADDVSLSDGILEILVIRSPQNPLEFQKLMRSLHEKDYNNDIIRCMHGKKVRLRSDVPIAWTVDGESGGEHLEVVIKVKKQCLEFIY